MAASTIAVVVPGTNLIHVSVTGTQAEDAVLLTNAVSNAFVKKLTAYQASNLPTTQGVVPNEPAYVFQGATSAAKVSTGLARKVILEAVVGLVLSVLLILLLDYLDITIKSPEELEGASETCPFWASSRI